MVVGGGACFGGGSSYCDSSRYDVVSSRNTGTRGRTFTCCIQYHDRGSGASACGGRRFIGRGRIYCFNGGISSTRCINVTTYNVLLHCLLFYHWRTSESLHWIAMLAGSVGTLAMAAALLSVNSSMKSISKNAKSAQKSITSMKDSVSIVNDGLDALGNKAKSAVNSLVSAFNDGAGRARSAGQKMGDGVKDGVTKGLQPLPNIANQNMSRFNSALSSGASRATTTANMMSVSIVAALNSAAPGAYSSGLSIGISFANGLSASLGRIQSIAAQMSAAASSAAAAKASMPKTRSIVPAETVMEPMAVTYGLTYTMDRSIDVPTIASVDPVRNTHVNTSSGGRELSDEYNYRGNVTYTFVVTSELDGKEIAKATAVYTQDELEKLEKKKNEEGRDTEMYSFIDVDEYQRGMLLPSEAMNINGKYIENEIEGYRTLQVEGRELLETEVSDFRSDSKVEANTRISEIQYELSRCITR